MAGLLHWLRGLLARWVGTKLSVKGHIHLVVRDKDGKVLGEQWVNNTMVAQGKQRLMQYLAGTSTAFPSYIAASSNNTAPADTETSVPSLIIAKSATKTYELYSNMHSVKFTATIATNEANGSTIASIALCETSTGGGEWCRAVLTSPISKSSDISVEINYFWSYQ